MSIDCRNKEDSYRKSQDKMQAQIAYLVKLMDKEATNKQKNKIESEAKEEREVEMRKLREEAESERWKI